MKVQEIMTRDPACCAPETPLEEVARLMVEHDCGCIPVLDEEKKPIGVITDRDICCRAVAQGKNPLELKASDCMTDQCIVVTPDTSVDDCCATLEKNQIRRAVVVDDAGRCCGIVAQADLAERTDDLVKEVVRSVSRPTDAASGLEASATGKGGCCKAA